jgi:hypothetical protein
VRMNEDCCCGKAKMHIDGRSACLFRGEDLAPLLIESYPCAKDPNASLSLN